MLYSGNFTNTSNYFFRELIQVKTIYSRNSAEYCTLNFRMDWEDYHDHTTLNEFIGDYFDHERINLTYANVFYR